MSKQVLVTGGAKRLGAELVRAFAHAGWSVWCHYQHSETEAVALARELSSLGHTVDVVQADLAHTGGIEKMMAHIESQRGSLRAVINNASSFEPDTGIGFDPQLARDQLNVNLIAPLLMGKLLAQQQVAAQRNDGCVIHILDQKVFNLNPDYFSYTTSKLALEQAVALQAQALAPTLRVCGVAPGLMYLSGPQERENFDIASRINLRRQPIEPSDVANTCLFLAENASITGTTLCVDNGQHLVPLARDVMFMVDDYLRTAQ